MRIYVRHLRAARPPLCTSAAPDWFAMRGLDWNRFLAEGIDAELLRALNDPISNRALAAAEAEESGRQADAEPRSTAELRIIARRRRNRGMTDGR